MGVFRSFAVFVKGASPLSRAHPEAEALQTGKASLRTFLKNICGFIISFASKESGMNYLAGGVEYCFISSSTMLWPWPFVYSAADDAAVSAIIFIISAPCSTKYHALHRSRMSGMMAMMPLTKPPHVLSLSRASMRRRCSRISPSWASTDVSGVGAVLGIRQL